MSAATWREALPAGLRPYVQREPAAAFCLGVSSGFPYAMLAATLTTRLAQDGIDKKSVTAFSLAFLPQPGFGFALLQVLWSILCYPLVVAASRFTFDLRKPAMGEVDAYGRRL